MAKYQNVISTVVMEYYFLSFRYQKRVKIRLFFTNLKPEAEYLAIANKHRGGKF